MNWKQWLYVQSRRPWREAAERRVDAWVQAESEALGSMLGSADANQPAILLVANRGYTDFVENWYRHFARLGMTGATTIAMDDEAHGALSRAGIPVQMCRFAETADADFAAYGERSFNRITAYKILYVHLLLRAGRDVLLTDGDTVWLRDPLPLLNADTDLQIQIDNPGVFSVSPAVLRSPKVCTGFFLARSNERTVAFFREVLVRLEQMPRFNDQHCANWALRTPRQGSVLFLPPGGEDSRQGALRVTLLDPLLFANGSTYFNRHEEFLSRGVTPAMVHANWIHGKQRKIQALRQHGLWLI